MGNGVKFIKMVVQLLLLLLVLLLLLQMPLVMLLLLHYYPKKADSILPKGMCFNQEAINGLVLDMQGLVYPKFVRLYRLPHMHMTIVPSLTCPTYVCIDNGTRDHQC